MSSITVYGVPHGQSTGKSNQTIITNEKGRLAQAEIDRMMEKVEKFCAESESNKANILTKTCLELFHMRNTPSVE